MSEEKRETLDYYLKPEKFIRDHAHEYVFLTGFELSLVDTIEFQRLKNIRQLTCQHVYPGARHTRFEHSLGVMELTRQAMDALDRNGHGYLSEKKFEGLGDGLRFNGALAALLHDVGHCPFSHLGEREFDRDAVWRKLYGYIEEKLPESGLRRELEPLDIRKKGGRPAPTGRKLKSLRKRFPGAVHEQLSCCVILGSLYERLARVERDSGGRLSVDFELVCRSILGLEYDTSLEVYAGDKEAYEQIQKKNVIVHLINSRAFDMDKLDYIMRDSCMTKVGTPVIDTNRLFRNMYLDNDCAVVFSSRAVPALQNMVDARDKLYMYVYNHHAVIFSDFMYTYIFRRMARNARDLKRLLEQLAGLGEPKPPAADFEERRVAGLGSVPKGYLFSPQAVMEENRSDGDLIWLLNEVRLSLRKSGCGDNGALFVRNFVKYLNEALSESGAPDGGELKKLEGRLLDGKGAEEPEKNTLYLEAQACCSKIRHTYELVERHMRRDYLKPWWKTYSEFNLFINHNFLSDDVRRRLCDWICNGEDGEPEGDEFRSQLAKHVAYITQDDRVSKKLCMPLETGDFFVIERSARFFDPETLKELKIAQKANEIVGGLNNAKRRLGDYYIKELPQIMPQKNYYSVYAKNSFYVFSRRLERSQGFSPEQERRHYQLIEQIFVFVATELVNLGAYGFQSLFGRGIPLETKRGNEKKSQEELRDGFLEKNMWEG